MFTHTHTSPGPFDIVSSGQIEKVIQIERKKHTQQAVLCVCACVLELYDKQEEKGGTTSTL